MLSIEIDGIDYSGWLNATLTNTITDLAGTFSFSFTDLYRQSNLPAIRAGLSCKIYRKGVLQKSGYIDSVNPSFSSDSVSFSISGRDKAGDIIDCSIVGDESEFKDLNFQDLVNRLCSPFGISANIENGISTGDKVKSIKYEQGASVYEVIKKEAQKRQLLVYSGKDGNLLIARAGTKQAGLSLVEGVNILSGSGNINANELFSKYIVKGTKNADLKDTNFDEKENTQILGEVSDNTIQRTRPLIIVQSGNLTNDLALSRAKWEASSRIATSESYNVTVQGWYPDVNCIINLRSPTIYTSQNEAQLLIAGVELSHTQSGETTTFTLVPRNAFNELPSDLIELNDKEDKNSKYMNLFTKTQATKEASK